MSQSTTNPDADPLTEALRRKVTNLADRVEELEVENKELHDRVLTLEQRVPEPSQMDYEAMDKSDRATVVRQKLKDTAKSTNGKAKFEYKDVIAVFDGHPSAGYAYDLMEAAAKAGGFEYNKSPGGTKRLTYDVRKDPDA